MRRDGDAALCTWRDNRSSVGATGAPTATARRARQNQLRLRGAGGAPLPRVPRSDTRSAAGGEMRRAPPPVRAAPTPGRARQARAVGLKEKLLRNRHALEMISHKTVCKRLLHLFRYHHPARLCPDIDLWKIGRQKFRPLALQLNPFSSHLR
jgi:hypothetical protein